MIQHGSSNGARDQVHRAELRTWELVSLPDCHRPIIMKWVFKLKKGELGAVIKHKAKLVAHGFV